MKVTIQRPRPVAGVQRWCLADRVTHWLLLAGVLLCVLTGLPLFFRAYAPLTEVFTIPNHGLIHRVGAILLVVAALIHVSRIMTNLREFTRSAIVLRIRDIRDFIAIALHWVGLKKEYPEVGFHHPGEKFIYWGTAVCGLITLGVTGIILWFPDAGALPLWFLTTSGLARVIPGLETNFHAYVLLLHDIGFVITTVPLIGHFLLAINPVNAPALKAMLINGRVPVQWAQTHHPGWRPDLKVIQPMGPSQAAQRAVVIGVKAFSMLAIALRVLLGIILISFIVIVLLG